MGWDFTTEPDIFWKLFNESETETYFNSEIINDANYNNLPFTFTDGLPYTIDDLTNNYAFEFYDYDFPDTDDNLNYSTYCFVNPSNFTDYPSIIHFGNSQMKFDLYVTWSNSKKSFSKNNIERTIKSNVSK